MSIFLFPHTREKFKKDKTVINSSFRTIPPVREDSYMTCVKSNHNVYSCLVVDVIRI